MKLFTLSLSITIEAENFEGATTLADSLVKVVARADVAVVGTEVRMIVEIDEEGFEARG